MSTRYRILVLLLALVAAPLWAQTSPVEQAEEAYRSERFDEALALLERHLDKNPADASAQYLLARVYSETPLANEGRARRALDAALKADPDNVDYLTAHLILLRSDRLTFIEDKLREQRRLELAEKILKLDPENALAHEELGRLYIKDFWRYRNAISYPLLTNERGGVWADRTPSPISANDGGYEGGALLDPLEAVSPDEVFLADRFDLEALESLGVPALSYSGRAQSAYNRAIKHLEAALENDPRRRPVYDDFMRIYTLKGDWNAALERLQSMYTYFPEDADTWLYLGLAHLRAGNEDASSRSFRTAMAFMSEEERAMYEDISLLLTADERRRYRDDPEGYAARFWTAEDPRLLTAYNERKLEHYARLSQAEVLYSAPKLDLHGWDTERGQILVRYGMPQREVYIVPGAGGSSIRTVLRNPYATTATQAAALFEDIEGAPSEGGDTKQDDAFNSVDRLQRNPASDERQISSNADGYFNELNTYNIWDYGTFRFVFEDPFRNNAFRLYSPSARDISEGVDPWRNDYVLIAREIEKQMPQRYTYDSAARRVELPYLVTSFRGTGGATDVYVHYGVSIPDYDPEEAQVDVTANVGTFLVSPERDVLVERRRTLYGLRTDQIVRFEEANLWVDSQKMEAPSGEHTLSVEFETASGSTMGVQRRQVEVPSYEGERLALSDLLLAYRVEEAESGTATPGDIVRGDLTIKPAPWSVFRRNQPLYLYYEAYHLGLGTDGMTDYEVEVELAPRDDRKGLARVVGRIFSRKDGVSLRFPGSGNQPDLAEYQILDVVDQEPGLYTLTLRVRDKVSGRAESRTQDLFLE